MRSELLRVAENASAEGTIDLPDVNTCASFPSSKLSREIMIITRTDGVRLIGLSVITPRGINIRKPGKIACSNKSPM